MLAHCPNLAGGVALLGYIVSGFALAVRLESIRRTHPLAKTIPAFGVFTLGLPTAWLYVWGDSHISLKDRWVDRWVLLTRGFMVAAGLALIAWVFAKSQAGS